MNFQNYNVVKNFYNFLDVLDENDPWNAKKEMHNNSKEERKEKENENDQVFSTMTPMNT